MDTHKKDSVYIVRQPILTPDETIFAYNLPMRVEKNLDSEVMTEFNSMSRALVNVLNNVGIGRLLGDKTGFISIDEKVLTEDILIPMEKECLVLSLDPNISVNPVTATAILELKEEGFVFSLDDFIIESKWLQQFRQFFRHFSYVKIDLNENNADQIKEKVKLFDQHPVKFIAENVNDRAQFEQCRDMGFDHMQGFFFAKPIEIEGRKLDPSKLAVMELFNLLQKDPDIHEIESVFKNFPDITVSLLRFINSVAFYRGNKIGNIRHAVAFIGRKKLFQWLLLMMYSKPDQDPNANSVFTTAIQRAKAMEVLAKSSPVITDRDDIESSYLCGVMSLMDTVLQIPMTEALSEFHIEDKICDAILNNKGNLGNLLRLVVAWEQFDMEVEDSVSEELGVNCQDLSDAFMEGCQLVTGI